MSGANQDEVRETHAQIATELWHVAERLLDRGLVPPPYLRRHLTEHALEGRVLGARSVLDRLLPYLDIARLQAALSRYPARTREELLMRKLIRQVAHRWQWAHPEVNAFALDLWNVLAGNELSLVTRSPWAVRWAHQRAEHDVLVGRFAAEILSLASVVLPDGRSLVVSVGGDGYLRAWDGGSGLQLFATNSAGSPSCVAAGLSAAGAPLAITGDREGNVRWWDLETGFATSEPVAVHNGPVLAMVTTPLLHGDLVAVTGGEDGAVCIVDTHAAVDDRRFSLEGSVEAVEVVPTGHGGPVIVAGGNRGVLWRWAPRNPTAEPLAGQPDPVRALAVARSAGGTVICGGADGWISRWDIAAGVLRGAPTRISGRPVGALTVVADREGDDVVVVCQDRQLTVVDPNSGRPRGRRWSTGEGTIAAVSGVRLGDGQASVMTGGRDGTVRQWEIFAEEWTEAGPDHEVDDVTAVVTTGPAALDAVVVTGTAHGTVHVWRAADGGQLFETGFGSASPLCTLALLTSSDEVTLVGERSTAPCMPGHSAATPWSASRSAPTAVRSSTARR